MKLPKARTENIVVQEADEQTFVYDLTADKAYLLNETSAFVWRMCDGENDLAAVCTKLAAQTKQPVSEDIVKLAIDNLRANNLLNEPETAKNFFTKTNRRKAVKQIGLATMIALPVISALTAPTAANAASGCLARYGIFPGTPNPGCGNAGPVCTPQAAKCCSGRALAVGCTTATGATTCYCA